MRGGRGGVRCVEDGCLSLPRAMLGVAKQCSGKDRLTGPLLEPVHAMSEDDR